MTFSRRSPLAPILLIFGATVLSAGALVRAAEERSGGQPFAVVELFTSEGCSSCPPAEELLSRIAADARTSGRPIHVVAFHVDYWDRLGWKDPFSAAAYTERQHRYGAAFRATGVYTPQMIVNGREGFNGSDGRKASSEINQALAHPGRVAVSLRIGLGKERGHYGVRYEVSPVPVGAVLNVAVTQDGLVVKVNSGENGGKTLKHDGVVRGFKTLPLPAEGKNTLDIVPPEGAAGKGQVILYVQDPKSMEILGASAARIRVETALLGRRARHLERLP